MEHGPALTAPGRIWLQSMAARGLSCVSLPRYINHDTRVMRVPNLLAYFFRINRRPRDRFFTAKRHVARPRMSRAFYSNSLSTRTWLCCCYSSRCGSLRATTNHRRRHSTKREEQPPAPSTPQRLSPLDIQMLSAALHRQIFRSEPEASPEAVSSAKEHLAAHGLWGSKGG